MDKQIKNKFPKGFFTNIASSNVKKRDKVALLDKDFEWSKEVIEGKTTVKIVKAND